MRTVLIALLLLSGGCDKIPTHAKKIDLSERAGERHDAVHPFPQAAEVRLFTAHTDQNMKVTYDKGRSLTAAQRRAYEALLYVQTDGDLSVAACFDPHHFVRYYDAKGKKIGEVAVCFCCGGVEMTPSNWHLRDNQLFTFNYVKLKALIASWGVDTDIDCPPDITRPANQRS